MEWYWGKRGLPIKESESLVFLKQLLKKQPVRQKKSVSRGPVEPIDRSYIHAGGGFRFRNRRDRGQNTKTEKDKRAEAPRKGAKGVFFLIKINPYFAIRRLEMKTA